VKIKLLRAKKLLAEMIGGFRLEDERWGKWEVGSLKFEAGSWKLGVGSWKLEVGSGKLEVNREQTTDNR
jgi:hypothetical protein